MKTIMIISTLAILTSCGGEVSDQVKNNTQDIRQATTIDFDSLPTISGADTIVFNEKIDYLSGPNMESSIGNWFQLNSDLNYLVEQKINKNFVIHELQIYNAGGSLLANKLLSDTSFVLKSPKRRISRAYRKANWLYIESGIQSGDSLIVLKYEKFEIVSLLNPEYDDKFVDTK